jgi:hypothetical protein
MYSTMNHGYFRRPSTTPLDILGLGEEILHQALLARQLDLNVALAKATTTSARAIHFEAVDCVDCLIEVHELNVCVEGLACHTLHDDVHGFVFDVADNASITAKESENLGTGDGIGNLKVTSAIVVSS